jgi:cardiolipin synthase
MRASVRGALAGASDEPRTAARLRYHRTMLSGWEKTFVALCGLALQLTFAALVLVRRPQRQSSALAWILVVVLLPGLGIGAFLLFGDVRLGRRRRERHREIVTRVRTLLRKHPYARPAELDDIDRSIANLGYLVGETEPQAGNRLELHGDTQLLTKAMVADLDAAEAHAHLLTYIFLADEAGRAVSDALLRAAARGVACRLLVDAAGSRPFLRSPLRRELDQGGVRVVAALPRRVRLGHTRIDLRNHRKILVVDGRLGYTGSHNIASAAFAPKPKFAPWVDATVRVEGPAVRDLEELFVQDWYLETGETLEECLAVSRPPFPGGIPVQVIGTGPGSRHEAVVRLIQAAFHLAREELILTTPYFVPDEGTYDALLTAAERGVRTVLVVPHRNDSRLVAAASRGLYEPLLDSGVEVHEYTRGLLHAKTITVDRRLAIVSTANLDRRSFELNYEASLVVYDADFASRLCDLQRSYLASSLRIDRAEWAERRWPTKILHNAAGIVAPIL